MGSDLVKLTEKLVRMGQIPLPVFVGGGGAKGVGDGRRSINSKSEAIETRSKPLHQNVPVRPQSSPTRRRTRPHSAASRPSSAQVMLPSSAASSHKKDFLAAPRRKRPQSAKPSTKLENPFRNVDAVSHFFPNSRELWNVFEIGSGETVPVEAAIPHTHAVAASSELGEELERFRNSRAPTAATRMDAFNRFVSVRNSAVKNLLCAQLIIHCLESMKAHRTGVPVVGRPVRQQSMPVTDMLKLSEEAIVKLANRYAEQLEAERGYDRASVATKDFLRALIEKVRIDQTSSQHRSKRMSEDERLRQRQMERQRRIDASARYLRGLEGPWSHGPGHG